MASIGDKLKNAFSTGPSHDPPQITHRKKVLLAVSSAAPQMPDHRSGYYWSELLHPYEVFVGQGWDCDIVSENGQATVDEKSLKDASSGDRKKFEDKEFPLAQKLLSIRPASAVNPSLYCAIFFAGGHAACQDFPQAYQLKRLAAQIYENGGVVGGQLNKSKGESSPWEWHRAVCHGPAIFQDLKLSNGKHILEGKEATGFSNKGEEKVGADKWMRENGFRTMQDVVMMSGGKWMEHDSDPMKDYTRCDDRIVTGMNPASAKTLAETMLKYFPAEKEFESSKDQTLGTTMTSTTGNDSSKLNTNLSSSQHTKGDLSASELQNEKGRTFQSEQRSTRV